MGADESGHSGPKSEEQNKNQKMSGEQPKEEDGAKETEVGPVGEENMETKVEFRPSRGTNRMSEERPIITGVVGAKTDK